MLGLWRGCSHVPQPTVTHVGVTLTAPSFTDDTGIAQRWTQNRAINTLRAPEADGTPTPTYAVQGSLPAGISFNTTTRIISGTPSAVGSGTITIRATNSEGSADWTVTYAITAPTLKVTPSLEIDWDNDGTFGHSAADVTGSLMRRTLSTTRGRTLQNRRRATSGRLEAQLWNLGNRYDPQNTGSLIFGKEISGIRVRLLLGNEVVWGGVLDDIRYVRRPVPYVHIIALGRLSSLRQPVSVGAQASITTGQLAKLIGAAAGANTTHLGGNKTLDRWQGTTGEEALLALQDIQETEEGFLYERGDGELVLEAENARATGAPAISALALSDTLNVATDIPLIKGSYRDWGFKEIANLVKVSVINLEESATITLWTAPQAITVPANGTAIISIIYPSSGAPSTHRGATTWVLPVAGTDYTAQTGFSLSGAVTGDRYVLTLANSSSSEISIPALKVRGKALIQGDVVEIVEKDQASITAFGEREYNKPAPFFTSIAAAREYAQQKVAENKGPHGWLVARWPGHYAAAKAGDLDISRRITVERGGERIDYHIEGIGVKLRGGGYVVMEYLLSPVPGKTAPSAPQVTSATQTGTSMLITWDAPFDGGDAIDDYDVRYKLATASTWTDAPFSGVGLSTTLTGLQGGASYQIQVRASNSVGTGAWSESYLTSLSSAPTAPAAPMLTLTGTDTVIVSWGAPFDGGDVITDYDVQYRKTGIVSPGGVGARATPREFDLHSANDDATGIAVDDTYAYVTDMPFPNTSVYVYQLSNGNRVTAREFDLPSANPLGIAVDDTYAYVVDIADDHVYVYQLSNGNRVTAREFELHADNDNAPGIAVDDTYAYVVDSTDDHVYVYQLSNGSRVTAREFTLHADNSNPSGISVDDTYAYVVDRTDDHVYVYQLSNGNRVTVREFALPTANRRPEGIAVDDTYAYVVDRDDDHVYVYQKDVIVVDVSETFATWPHDGAARTATITGLDINGIYEFQVRAGNAVGESPWSPSDTVEIP